MASMLMWRGQAITPTMLAHSSNPAEGPQLCFNCERIFQTLHQLEVHTCPAASHICSCGTEFPVYVDMLLHSTTHEPGHQVLDHWTIKKQRFEKCQEVKAKLRRLESVHHGPTDMSRLNTVRVGPLVLNSPPSHIASPLTQEVPKLFEISESSKRLPNTLQSTMCTKSDKMVAPTVDLWTLYHPVVLIKSVHTFQSKNPYVCGKCGQCFMKKRSLLIHHSHHATDKVAGCVGCGLLLSSKKMMPRLHQCNALSLSPKLRLITAKPLSHGKLTRFMTNNNRSLVAFVSHKTKEGNHIELPSKASCQYYSMSDGNVERHCVEFSQHLKSQYQSVSRSNSHTLHATVSAQWKQTPSSQKTAHVISSKQEKLSVLSAANAYNFPPKVTTAPDAYTCRVCLISFLTPQLLQRHKCVKAQEFMVKHRQASKQLHMYRKVSSPNIHLAGENVKACCSRNVTNVGVVRENHGFDLNEESEESLDDDDCFIVESNLSKASDMIYQVSSSFPVKT